MEALLRVFQVFLAIGLIGVVLLQRSEGGGLGIGSSGGMGSFMSVRGTANFLTRVTAILAALFMITCLALALIAKPAQAPRSIFDTPAPVPAPVAPVTPLGQTPAVPAPAPAEKAPETAPPTPQAEAPAAPPAPSAPTTEAPVTAPPPAAAPATPAPSVPPVVSTPTIEIPAAPTQQPATKPSAAKHKKTGAAHPSGQ